MSILNLLENTTFIASAAGSGQQREQLTRLLDRSFAASAVPVSKPAVETKVEAEPDPADKLLDEVADRLDPADLEAIRADPEVKRRFVKRLQNQRALNEEKRQQREAAEATAREQASVAERNRLAALAARVAKAEVDQ